MDRPVGVVINLPTPAVDQTDTGVGQAGVYPNDRV
jgi:hypothetical protein